MGLDLLRDSDMLPSYLSHVLVHNHNSFCSANVGFFLYHALLIQLDAEISSSFQVLQLQSMEK